MNGGLDGGYKSSRDEGCTRAEQANAASAQRTGGQPGNPARAGDVRRADAVEASFAFLGRLAPDSFRDFARRRAARLSPDLEEGGSSAQSFACRVSGPRALVDAFEMACSLGPLDCLVLDVRHEDRGEALANHG